MIRRRDLVSEVQRQTANYFSSKGYEVRRKNPHILARRETWKNNIILRGVADYIMAQKKHRKQQNLPFPLHKWIHHGLSSQACLFKRNADREVDLVKATIPSRM